SVCCAVVNAGHAGLVTRDVVQQCFNDMRLDTQTGAIRRRRIRHPGRHGAADIMMRPTGYPTPLVQSYLRVVPVREAAMAVAEQKVPARTAFYRFDYFPECAR